MMVDKMAQRYHMLPSVLLNQATIYDLRVMDVADSYVNYRRALQENKGRPPAPKMTEEEMVARIEKATAEARAKGK
jgi:hypothetical protein